MKFKFTIAFYCILLATVFNACRQNSVKQIRSHAVFFYSGYDGNYRTADRSVFTQELGELMDKAAVTEKAEAAAMKASSTPNDKPRMIEGDVLCGLYEGFDKYEIISVKEMGNEAIVAVELKNTGYNIKWTDTLLMKKQDGWKIDNIRFGKKQGFASSARDVFSQFVNFKSGGN